MKRNISVFILLILLASSYKYRTKATESIQPHLASLQPLQEAAAADHSLNEAIERMQQANLDLAHGNDSLAKALWSRKDDVTMFTGPAAGTQKGWEAVEDALKLSSKQIAGANTYISEKIGGSSGAEQAYLVQTEQYGFPNGKTVNFQATILFQKEGGEWKIIHRHADKLATVKKPDKTSK
ncbi:nuclear transport factor 2 family protein [Dyadobacter flavalbus]|uniref:Nuclear transport factor 2 family protein n=1 Tax=Dyadobacter flavalbus TaxID=2579942 RepID=A0A5M8QV07_9BACT|nr:nuclear transport factor 2 family protein [Dyadobacter flavalbus]KAA6439979.1 nuclear transport factor 2 family protein [Dyadobacter flavalbus]